MKSIDIAIAGGGLAGSLAAAMLARRGYEVALIDRHERYPPDLRCEKLMGRQVAILRRTSLADPVLAAATLDGESLVVQFTRVVERRPADQWGIHYHTLVNTVRDQIPGATPHLRATMTGIRNSAGRQVVALSDGEEVSARLVVVASGLNRGLHNSLGMERQVVSKCHCVTLAFDLQPVRRSRFDFRALTYFPERTAARLAYLTLFPIGQAMRANLMTYWQLDDPWLQRFKEQPADAITAVLPGLRRYIGDVEVAGPLKIRPADLCTTLNHLQAGVVLVGDAFATSCPATGFGVDKVFTDVERLCNVHVPRWMASAGMGVEKIGAYYADPVKVACDRRAYQKAFSARSMAVEVGLGWEARRWARFLGRMAIGKAREIVLPETLHPSPL